MEHNGTMRFFSKLAMEGNPNQGAPLFDEVDYECEIDDCRKYSSVKGQLISKCFFGVIVWTKRATKILSRFLS